MGESSLFVRSRLVAFMVTYIYDYMVTYIYQSYFQALNIGNNERRILFYEQRTIKTIKNNP
jgi:hypothetical protein